MNSTTIKINGSKLRSLLESSTGKSIYEIAKESGYSKNVISNAVRSGYASSAVQNIAKLYGISPEAYKVAEEVKDNTPRQLSISDYEAIQRDELKTLIKEALVEALSGLSWSIDPKTNTVVFFTEESKK